MPTPIQPDLFGTEPYKLHRAEGPGTSVASAHKVDSASWERSVLAVIARYGLQGAISDTVVDNFPANTRYSSVTARYKALDDYGYIARNEADRRPGKSGSMQMVMRITVPGAQALALTEDQYRRKHKRTRTK